MKIKFCGAAQTVTGSQHLLTINGKTMLLDCGMFQGKREESYQMNRKFLFDPKDLDCVILSHAHIDHSGNLPALGAKGFTGSIYCTSATRDLCAILLQDSAYIQKKDVEYVNKKRAKNNEPEFNPLYTINDAINILKNFKSFPYNSIFYPDCFEGNVGVTFIEAGHILGSSQIILDINENGKKYKIGFSGDLGRNHLPILKDPEFMGNLDYLLIESTYGGRLHDSSELLESELKGAINEAVKNKSKIIVPSFSVGRTQELIYEISKLISESQIPEFPVYVDSPLTVNATEIFKLHPECFDEETAELISKGVNVFGMDNVLYIKDVEDSKKLNSVKGPCMIISASGMCEAGRILHHLSNNIENPNNTILIIGYMAANTLGRRIIDECNTPGAKVKIFGDEYKLKAKVKILSAFSAHADQTELLTYMNKFDKNILKKIFLVHGEPEQQDIFITELEKNGYKNISNPFRGETIEI